ncbi:MAG TPA: SpoIID/LytB domain-containing protein, partial [Thermoanaerobaculia bacterium]|nr:SpoIID/LytB domain-containing protein [Thermoanaerobaculia bacterium]
MKQISALLLLALVTSCASAPPAPAPVEAEAVQLPSNRMTAVASVPKSIAEPRIRVGLLSDQSSMTFPRVEGGYYIHSDAGPSLIRRGFVVTSPVPGAAVRYAVQGATIWPLTSAEETAARLRTETGQQVDLAFDPASGQYKILVGDFPEAAAAQPLRSEMSQRAGGGRELPIVRRPAAQTFERRLEIVDDEGDRYSIAGESILIMPATAQTLLIGDKPYRTAARLFINSRGLLNVINELNLEDYLFGVVPAEMGPRIYDEIEGLKAQAVAARTYAVRNFRQFASEGFDICPGPQCQAYKGFSGEEALSTQAVKETAGLIATHGGKPIDALYTATCGGETSDVSTMFPGRSDPYLKRARCVEMEMVTLAGRADSGLLTETQVAARVFASLAHLPESGGSWSARDVEAAVRAAQRLLGVTAPAQGSLGSSRRGDVLRYLSAAFRLEEKARALTLAEDRRYFFNQTAEAEDAAHLAAAFLIKFGVVPAQHIDRLDLNAAMPREELYALLGS